MVLLSESAESEERRDGYPRYIISLDKFRDQQEGVHHINAIDLFLGKETIQMNAELISRDEKTAKGEFLLKRK